MLDFVTEQRKEACTILGLTKTYLNLCFCSRQHNTDTIPVPCCFCFGQDSYCSYCLLFQTHLVVILENLQSKIPLLPAMVCSFSRTTRSTTTFLLGDSNPYKFLAINLSQSYFRPAVLHFSCWKLRGLSGSLP